MLTIHGKEVEVEPMTKSAQFYLTDKFRKTEVVGGKTYERVASYRGVQPVCSIKDERFGSVEMRYFEQKGVQVVNGKEIVKYEPKRIFINNGKLLVPKTRPDLFLYLMKCPDYEKTFVLYDSVKDAENKQVKRALKHDAESYVMGRNKLPIGELRNLAIGLSIPGAGQMEDIEIEKVLGDLVEEVDGPKKFVDAMKSTKLDVRVDMMNAIEENIIKYKESAFWWVLEDGRLSKITKVPAGETSPKEFFVEWLQDIDDTGVLDNIQSKLFKKGQSANERMEAAAPETEIGSDAATLLRAEAEELGIEGYGVKEIIELKKEVAERKKEGELVENEV